MNNTKQTGFTLIELTIVIAILGVIGSIVYASFSDTRGATQSRAEDNMNLFISNNHLQVKRKSCAGDSDGDGYGSCTIVTTEGEKIFLQCPSDYLGNLGGGTGCKETLGTVKAQ